MLCELLMRNLVTELCPVVHQSCFRFMLKLLLLIRLLWKGNALPLKDARALS